MLQTTEETELTMPSDFRWHFFLVSAGYLPDTGIYVKFRPEEVEILHNRMKEAGVQNMSAFIRKMVLNGYMIIPEWSELKGVLSLHSRISNNLNQYAKKANETGNIYREDIAELKEMHVEETKLLKKRSSQLYIGDEFYGER